MLIKSNKELTSGIPTDKIREISRTKKYKKRGRKKVSKKIVNSRRIQCWLTTWGIEWQCPLVWRGINWRSSKSLAKQKKKLPTRLNNPVMTLLLESSEGNLIEISLPKVRTNRRKKNPNHLKGYVLDWTLTNGIK